MLVLLHLLWLCLKGLFVYAAVLAAGVASTWLAFGPPPTTRTAPWDAFPGFIGGGLLMAALVLGGVYIALGGRP